MSPEPDFERLLRYLAATRSFDFTSYKRSSLMRRTRQRLQVLGIDSFAAYQDYLEANTGEFAELFDTLLINVTGFFRDPPAWNVIAEKIIPDIVETKQPGENVRVWSAACASGQEAFTLAMLFTEYMGPERAQALKIYATDVDEGALAIGRGAVYSTRDLENVPEALRAKYFDIQATRAIIRPELRRMVIYGRHDLLRDAPMPRLDLLVCRNTLMYFNSESQQRILQRFFFAISENRYLFLGKAETLLSNSAYVTPVDARYRIFRKMGDNGIRDRTVNALQLMRDERRPLEHDDFLAEGKVPAVVFDLDPVAQIIVDNDGHLLLANNRARDLFRLTNRDLGGPFQGLELSFHPVELRPLVDRVYRDLRSATIEQVRWPGPGGEERWFDVSLLPLNENGRIIGIKVIYADASAYKRLQVELEQSQTDLETAYEDLQSANEELETTNEELQSTVEELETTNEELQSTNEELETMNEELRTTNNELEVLNDALQIRTDDQNRLSAFLQSILGSLRAGVIVLSRDLEIEVWNRTAEDQWGIRSEEAIGKHFLNLDIGLPTAEMAQAMRRVLTEGSKSDLAVDATNRRGKPVHCQILLEPRLDGQGGVLGLIMMVDAHEDGSRPRA